MCKRKRKSIFVKRLIKINKKIYNFFIFLYNLINTIFKKKIIRYIIFYKIIEYFKINLLFLNR